MRLLLHFYPQLEGHIDLSTPPWIQHYLGADEGGAVGLDHTLARFTDWQVMRHLDSRTAILGLWLTGQDTVTCGRRGMTKSGNTREIGDR